jgi:hypothetical protein
MNKAEKIAQLISLEHPLEPAVAEIVAGIKQDFFQLEEGAISKENQDRALLELDDALRKMSPLRTERLTGIYETLDEAQIDALIALHASGDKLREAMLAAHELKWDWVNAAKELSPTLNDIIVHAGVAWVVNNTEGDVARSVAAQPLEDLKPPVDPPAATEPSTA